jgi:hypothetical protein
VFDGETDELIDYATDSNNDGVDNDNNGTTDDESSWGADIDNNVLIHDGRREALLLNGDTNPYYIENNNANNWDVQGTYRYNEENVKLEFDIFTYDFGADGLPGDRFLCLRGDGKHQLGEKLTFTGFDDYLSDCGLDGICKYTVRPFDLDNDGTLDTEGVLNDAWNGPDADGTEGDGIWQPGDGWVDINENEQVDVDVDTWILTSSSDDVNNIWPLPNRYWDEGETIYSDTNGNGEYDSGETILYNGLAMEWDVGEPFTDCGVDDRGDSICEDDENWDDTFGNGIWDKRINPIFVIFTN